MTATAGGGGQRDLVDFGGCSYDADAVADVQAGCLSRRRLVQPVAAAVVKGCCHWWTCWCVMLAHTCFKKRLLLLEARHLQ